MFIAIFAILIQQTFPPRLNPSLILSARNGEAGQVESLVSLGADVNAKQSKTGWTALSAAAFYGEAETCRTLLEHGADPNARDFGGATPLFKATAVGGDDSAQMLAKKAEIVGMILDAGGDPQLHDNLGGPAWLAPLMNHQQALLNPFEERGVKGIREWKLQEAIAQNNLVDAQKWIHEGADVNYIDEDGSNALRESILNGNPELLQLILKAGADVNARFAKGWTALMIAVHQGRLDLVRLLIDAGADPGMTNDAGQTALAIAVAENRQEMIPLLDLPPSLKDTK